MSATCASPTTLLTQTLLEAIARENPGQALLLKRLSSSPQLLAVAEAGALQMFRMLQSIARAGECAEAGDVDGCVDALRGAQAAGAGAERMMAPAMERNGVSLEQLDAWCTHVQEMMVAYFAQPRATARA